MRIGTSHGTYAYAGEMEAIYARMRAHGYTAADHNLCDTNELWYSDMAELDRYCDRVRKAAEVNEMLISQIHGPWPTDDKTPENRTQIREWMRRAVYACGRMGSRHMVLHPVMPYGWGKEDDADFAEQCTVELLTYLIPECEKDGVIVCLENMPMTAHRISRIPMIVRAVEKVNSPYVGICLDTGHCNVFGDDLGEMVRASAKYLKVLHVHDNNGQHDQHLVPFYGTANWKSFTDALREIHFAGTMSLESNGPSFDLPLPIRESMERHIVNIARYLADQSEG